MSLKIALTVPLKVKKNNSQQDAITCNYCHKRRYLIKGMLIYLKHTENNHIYISIKLL